MPAAFPSDHDDDNGGPAGRTSARSWFRNRGRITAALGITIVGGLLLSQLLTLYTTPVVYLWFDRLAQRFSKYRIGNPIPHEGMAD